VSKHERRCFLHRVFNRTGLQIVYRHRHRTNENFDIFACHPGWSRTVGDMENFQATRAEQGAIASREECYQSGVLQLQGRVELSGLTDGSARA